MSTDLATTEHQPSKPPRIPPRVRQAVHLIATGAVATQKAAADRVGLSEQHLCRMLARPQVRAFMAREAARTIDGALPRAAMRFVELLEDKSGHIAGKVADRMLTSAGILKSDQSSVAVSVDVRAGFVLDLREPAPMIEASSSREDTK